MTDFKDWFVPAASGAAALLGVYNVHLNNIATNDIAALNSRIVQVGEERRFASDIMQRFDSVVVDEKAGRAVRIARLSGLLALANLMKQKTGTTGGLDVEGILTVIQSQAANYEAEIAVDLTRTSTGAEADRLQAQFASVTSIGARATTALNRLGQGVATASAAATKGASPKLSALQLTKVDIFWCAGRPESAESLVAANQLLAKRPPGTVPTWRVRALTPERQASGFYNVVGQVIRIDNESERGVADELAKLAPGFEVRLAPLKQTSGYISAFICPA